MKHIMLFEEFNPYSGEELAKRLRMFSEASEVVNRVSPVKQENRDFTFTIDTRLKGDEGSMNYKVLIPFSQIEKARVITFEKSKKKFSADIEIKNENDIEVILMNFFEATQLFDDNQIEVLVENYKKLNSAEEVKKLLKTLVPLR